MTVIPAKKSEKAGTEKKTQKSKRKTSGKIEVREKDIVEGLKFGFGAIDAGLALTFGISGVWTLSDSEAETLARVLIKRAESGNSQAAQLLEKILENIDEVQAAVIIGTKLFDTVKEVGKRGRKKPSPVPSPQQSPVQFAGQNHSRNADQS